MDWSGVDYCDVSISCLDSHSDGTHSLQRIHCMLSKWCNATFLQIWRRNKFIYILDDLMLSKCLANVHFWVNYSFNVTSCLVNQSPDVKRGIMENWLSAQTFLKVRSYHPSHHYYWHWLSSHLPQRWSQKRCFLWQEPDVSLCLIWSCITHTSSSWQCCDSLQ